MICKLKLKVKDPERVVSSLIPDNTENIKMRIEDGFLIVEIQAEKIGSIISSVDDIIVNCLVSEKVLEC
jgi:hypothetical protein